MSKLIDWIKEHVRPYAKIRDEDGDFPSRNEQNENQSPEDKISDDVKRTEVGIKLTWKW